MCAPRDSFEDGLQSNIDWPAFNLLSIHGVWKSYAYNLLHLAIFANVAAKDHIGILLAFWLLFSVVPPPVFGLGRGPITPPGPATV